LNPADVIGAGSTVEDLRERFADTSLAGPIAKDMAMEDGMLRNYISNCRLDHWVTTTRDWALRKLREEQEATSEEERQVEELMDAMQDEDGRVPHQAGGEGHLVVDAAAA
jgi:hypothetical protein